MKVAITGHTSGVGQLIYNYFERKGYTCVGFSRSNGYDITDREIRKKILEEIQDFDIFVNNARGSDYQSQYNMLRETFLHWKSQKKIIINMSSFAGDMVGLNYPNQEYAKAKEKLDSFCRIRQREPWIINLRPGYMDVKSMEHKQSPKMPIDSIDKVLDFILENRESFRVRSITFTADLKDADWN